MFEEGSPKESHRTTVRLVIIVSLLMIVTSCDSYISYERGSETTVLGLGGLIASGAGLWMVPVLFAWRRGLLDGTWPLLTSLIISAGASCYMTGEWYRAWSDGDTFVVSNMFYVTLGASLVTTAILAVGYRRPVIEQSESNSAWVSKRRVDP